MAKKPKGMKNYGKIKKPKGFGKMKKPKGPASSLSIMPEQGMAEFAGVPTPKSPKQFKFKKTKV